MHFGGTEDFGQRAMVGTTAPFIQDAVMSTQVLFTHHISLIKIDGLTVRCARSSRTDGTPLLLTAPWPESISAFAPIWERVGDLGPVVAVDLPGFGMSDGRQDLMSPKHMGDFLPRLMDALELPRVHAVAPDVGTLAVLFAAETSPERFASIVGGCGAVSMDLMGDPLRQIVLSSQDDFSHVEGGKMVVDLVRQSTRVPLADQILEDYRQSSEGQRWNQAAEFVRAYPRDLPRLARLLPFIKTPTMIISGKDDPFVPAISGSFVHGLMPHCRAEVLDAGHFVWEDAPDAYFALLETWISGAYLERVS